VTSIQHKIQSKLNYSLITNHECILLSFFSYILFGYLSWVLKIFHSLTNFKAPLNNWHPGQRITTCPSLDPALRTGGSQTFRVVEFFQNIYNDNYNANPFTNRLLTLFCHACARSGKFCCFYIRRQYIFYVLVRTHFIWGMITVSDRDRNKKSRVIIIFLKICNICSIVFFEHLFNDGIFCHRIWKSVNKVLKKVR